MPGCYVKTPTNCPKQSFSAPDFTRDTWGEANRNAANHALACLVTRKNEIDSWCGSSDTTMKFVEDHSPANTVCKMLGYEEGSAVSTTSTHSLDAFDVGYCRDGELGLDNRCTAGLNSYDFTAACKEQENKALMVKCSGGDGGKQHACSAQTKHGVCLAVYTGVFRHACKFTGRMPRCRHRLPWTCVPV